MEFILPSFVIKCIKAIESAGFKAYLVGGAVRDYIMCNTPNDFDIATSALPSEIMSIFQQTIPTGINHGTITVIIENHPIEVTTFRIDGNYADQRHPESVEFTNDIILDLSRRDFTIGAIAYNPDTGVFDPFCGIQDIKSKTIRTVGNASLRFSEDALRILRAFRFASTLGFNIEPNTLQAALRAADILKTVSRERLLVELKRTIAGSNLLSLNALLTIDAFNFLGLEKPIIHDWIINTKPDFPLRFALICNDCNSDIKSILKRLKCDKKTLSSACSYSEIFLRDVPQGKTELKYLLNIFGERLPAAYEALSSKGDLLAKAALMRIEEILKNNEPYRIDMLCITGNTLKGLGYNGAEIGDLLNKLLDAVIRNCKLNNKTSLLSIVNGNNVITN